MEIVNELCECECCLDELDDVISVKDKFKKNEAGEETEPDSSKNEVISETRKQRDRDAYKSFLRKTSKVQYQIDNSQKETEEFRDYRRSQNQTFVAKRIPLVNDVNFDNNRRSQLTSEMTQHYDDEFPILTSEEKELIFRTYMSPWINFKTKPKLAANKESKSRSKRKLSFMEKRRLTIEKTRKSINIKSLNSKDMEAFLATATAEVLQKYYRTIPARVDCKAPNFPANTFLRQAKLSSDLDRIKELRQQNFAICFKINQIQRTKGQVDHLVPLFNRSSKHEVMLKRIRNIERENLELYNIIQNAGGKLPTHLDLEEDWKKKLQVMRGKAKYPLTIPGLVDLERICDDEEFRPRVFLEFGIQNGNILGRIVISLYLELMPQTVTNFIALCENFQENLKENRKTQEVFPHLGGSPIHRIFPQLYFEGGDIVSGHGSTGKAARGVDFYPDSMNVPHNYDGTISMTITPDGHINSLFAISFRPLELLRGRRPAFGRVVKGFKLLEIIETYGTRNGKPKQTILITRCGLIYPK